MKKTVFFTALNLWVSLIFAQYSGGLGTKVNPYQIANLTDLGNLSSTSLDWDKHFILTNTIDASATSGWNGGDGFYPIGNSVFKFTGSFNGANYSISNLFINMPNDAYVGLFGWAEGDTIKNLNITNANITGLEMVAALVGRTGDVSNTNITTIQNISINNASITATKVDLIGDDNEHVKTGALVGLASNCNISNCNAQASLTGRDRIGGLVGELSVNASIAADAGLVTFCYTNVNMSSTGRLVGGLVGFMNNNTRVSYSYSLGDIDANGFNVGGLVGLSNTGSTISNSYSLVNVSGGNNIGGFIGFSRSTITNSYAVGEVTGLTNVGGFVGTVNAGSVSNSYWDNITSLQDTSDAGTGLDNFAMKLQTSFNTWDFDNDWAILSGVNISYPYLQNLSPITKPGTQVSPNIWLGNSTAWSDANNWSRNVVPNASLGVVIVNTSNQPLISANAATSPALADSLVIYSGATLTIAAENALTVSNNFVNNGTILLQSNTNGTATLIVDGEISGEGNNTVEQYFSGSNKNYYIGSPISNATASVLNTGTETKFSHNATTQRYAVLNNSTTLNPLQGYVVRFSDTETVTFTGEINNGELSNLNLPRTGLVNDKRGYNLVSNPYTSFVDWKLVSKTKLESSVWFPRTGGIFDTYNALSDIGTNNTGTGAVNEFLPPLQAFWVRVDEDGQTGGIVFDNTMRSHQIGKLRVVSTKDVFRFKIVDNTESDEAVIHFDFNADESFDDYDSRKFWTNSATQISTIANEEDVVINSLPDANHAVVETKLVIKEEGLYVLEATEQLGNLQGIQVVLEDKNTGNKVSFNAGEKYSFKGKTSDVNRFAIHFGDIPLSTVGVPQNSSLIYANNKQINIKLSEVNNAKVSVYNTSGQLVHTANLTNTLTQINSTLPSGIYVVEVVNGNVVTREKVIIQ